MLGQAPKSLTPLGRRCIQFLIPFMLQSCSCLGHMTISLGLCALVIIIGTLTPFLLTHPITAHLYIRDARVRFGLVRRPFFLNPEPLLGFSLVQVYSHSEPGPDPEPHFSAIIGNFDYIIKLNLHDHPPVHRKKRC